MKTPTWPLASVIIALILGIFISLGTTDDAATQSHLMGYLDTIVPFIIGLATGGAVAGTAGYLSGLRSPRRLVE